MRVRVLLSILRATCPPLHDDTPLRMCWQLRWGMRDLQAGEQT